MSEKSKSFFTVETNPHPDANVAYASWPEWKDSDLNNEKWGVPKDGPDGLFLDAERVAMPRSLEPDHWIRAKDLKHLTAPPTVYITTVEYPDLITNNKHLLHSEFVRWFVSALVNLQYCGREGLEISGESSNFTWIGRHSPWYGWMHVYSMNKAGKGVQHRPMINPNGKYIVRLHCMGCWRRILVDDMIPVDKNGRPLLPCMSNNYELWPMLLAKALLKIASLSWTRHHEIVDFHPVACLTGWTCLTMNVAHLSFQNKWDFLTKYSEHFEWTPQTAQNHVPESSTNKTDETRKPRETSQSLAAETEKPQPIALFFLLGDTRALGSDAIPGLSPCWDHVIHIVQSRNIPLDPKDVKPPLAKWKFHRWLKWAVEQNVIDPADYFVPIRYLRLISSLKECNESVVRDRSDVAGNSISSNEIERSDKFARRRTRSQRISDLPTMSKEVATENASQWIDFNKMASYVTEVHLFYKLEYFQCSIEITGNALKKTNENHKAEAVKAVSKEIGKEKAGTSADSYNSIGKILKSRYKPLYLFCDSPRKKFFLVSLCAALKKKNTDLHEKDYLILEKYNWFFISDPSNQSITISTTGSKSTIMELEAGRQLLRIHSRSDSGLTIISSDTDFHLGDRTTVQQLMTTESDRIEQLSKIISDNLCKAYRSFGTKDYPRMLENFYQSYMPSLQFISSKENKNFRTLIHHFFMEEQIRLIREIVPDEEHEDMFHSLRVFFLNPHIRSEYFNLMTKQKTLQDFTVEKTSRTSRSNEEVFDHDQAATTIQSFLKMVIVKGYKQLHNPDHALHTQIRERLLKISDLFDSSLASRLLRNVINRHSSLRDLYPCSEDFVHVLKIQEFRDVLGNVRHEQWFPIVRLVVNPKPAKTKVLAAFELLIDLPRFALRVFNNQNGREMTRLVSHVVPGHYEYLPNGYTVFAYGWSDRQHLKELHWTIRVVTMKGEPMFYQLGEQRPLSLETKPPRLMVDELFGTYIPNARSCISRWILRTTLERSIISIRLATSYNLTEIRIKVTDEDGNILVEVNGGSTVLLPLMILKHAAVNDEDYKTKNKSQDVNKEFENAGKKRSLYYIEAFVLNNSWPLTDVEWTVASQVKAKNERDIKTKIQSGNKGSSRSGLSTTKKNAKQFASDGQALETPYWILQIVTDVRDAVEICEDKSREQEIVLLKESWWSKDPNRLEYRKDLREAFLKAHASKIKPDASSNRNRIQLKSIEDEDAAFCLSHVRQYRTLKPPESHRHLSALDLTRYVRRDEIAKHYRIKTKSDDEILRNQHTAIIIDSQTNYSDYLRNLGELMNKQLRKYVKRFEKKDENFWQRRTLVDAAYETRKIYVNSLIAERAKTKAKGKKD
ncbi:androglobin [Temnothorax nylanderi]|uniref:androglobin n=1 Tax=Temnothorax nylanderi TaxID=102681 RepID=UPI003A867323